MLNFENSLLFKEGQESDVTLRNFFPPEGDWVWSTGKWSEISFGFEVGPRVQERLAELIIDLDVFKHEDKHPGQNVLVYLNGLRVGSLYCTHRMTIIFMFDPKILDKDENILILDTPDSVKPSDFGVEDGRSLGVQVFSVQIRKAG